MVEAVVLGGGAAGAQAAVAVARRARLDSGKAGYVELYAEPDSSMFVGAAVGPDAADLMAEITFPNRAQVPVETLADVVHAFPADGEVLAAPLRALAG